MKISCIVNFNLTKAIGFKNSLLYKISEDLKFFKEKTAGKPIIMGRKTFNSIGNCPLPKRTNIILTRDLDFCVEEGKELVKIYSDYLKIIEDFKNEDEIVIIGGQEIYKIFEKHIDIVYACEVQDYKAGDTYFTLDLEDFNREEISESYSPDYDLNYKFVKYERK